jgi:hypothetical protein
LTQRQCKAVRALHVSLDFEKGNRELSPRTVRDFKRVFEDAGVEFTKDKRPGVKLKG